MNFLAHLYLSKDLPEEIAVGNFMADAVKGQNSMSLYSEDMQAGIKLHRAIDSFTDSHQVFRQGTKRLHQNYGKFAPVIMDIYYDHILAVNWEKYADVSLQEFSRSQYKLLTRYKSHLPNRTRQWLRYMKFENLLYNYSSEEKIEKVLKLMDKRTANVSRMGSAINELRFFKDEYTQEFYLFFDEMKSYVRIVEESILV